MPLGDYGLGGREARGAYESAKASVGSNNSEKDGSSLAPDTSSRPRSRPDNVAPVRSDDNKSSAPSTSVRPRSRPDNVAPVETDSISITNEDTKKVEAYIDYLTGTIVYKDNSRLSKAIKDNVAKNLSSLYPDFSNKTINSLVEKHGPSLIGGLTSKAISMLSPEDRETLAAMQPLDRGINTTPESLREAFNITPGWKAMSTDINSIIGSLENPEQALENIVDKTSGTLDFGLFHPSFRGITGKIQGDKTISIGGKKTFAEGGKVSDEAQLEMELIMNEQVDPVSGNTAPVGAKPEEVRDDIEIRVSPGEYVINAQTVRYFGEDFFDELQKTAEEGFERIKEGEELPFRDDELDIEDDETEEVEPKGFAYGGRVKGYAEGDLVVPQPVGGGYGRYGGTGAIFMGYQSKTFINDETGQKIIIFFFNGRPLSRIPAGFREMGETPAEEQEIAKEEEKAVESDKGRDPMDEADRGWRGKSVDSWDMDDFKDYRDDMKNTPNAGKLGLVEKGIIGLVGSLIAGPLGGLALQKLAEKANLKQAENVTNVMNGLLSSGKNLDGSTLTATDVNDIFSISYEANVVNANLNPTGQTKGVSIFDQPFYSDGQGGLDIGALTPPTPDFSSISITPEEQAAADAAMAKAGKGYTTTPSSSKTSGGGSSGKSSSGSSSGKSSSGSSSGKSSSGSGSGMSFGNTPVGNLGGKSSSGSSSGKSSSGSSSGKSSSGSSSGQSTGQQGGDNYGGTGDTSGYGGYSGSPGGRAKGGLIERPNR